MGVLLPIDNSEARATAATAAVVALPNAADTVEVTILNVAPELDVSDNSIVRSEDWYDETDLQAGFEAAETMLRDVGIPVVTHRRHSDLATAILDFAGEIDPIES
jgi:nucleotide-binding universal stress UspA family protein